MTPSYLTILFILFLSCVVNSKDHDPFEQIILSSSSGKLSVWVMPFGATMTHVFFPDKTGVVRDIVCGFDDPTFYRDYHIHTYFGAIVGRYANRIANGSFTLNGHVYHTPLNDNTDTLHGGDVGYDSREWNVLYSDSSSVIFNLYDNDLVESFPGALNVTVKYVVTDNNLMIDYEATTDTETIINLSSHTYWNLNGFAENIATVLDHVLMINAHYYTPVDDTLIPTGTIEPVTTAPWLDFTVPKAIGKDISRGTVTPNGGYDNNFVLDSHPPQAPVVTVYSPTTGIRMQIITTQPAVQFYSSNFLDGTIPRKSDQIYNGIPGNYSRYSALALETQHYPDSIHHSEWPNTILKKGELFHEVTVLKFDSQM